MKQTKIQEPRSIIRERALRDQTWADIRRYYGNIEHALEKIETEIDQGDGSVVLSRLDARVASMALQLVAYELDCRKEGVAC